MSGSSKKPQQAAPGKPLSRKEAKQAQKAQREQVVNRRTMRRSERERLRQRRFLIIIGSTIGVALLAIIIGLLYDQVWQPSRTVAEVGNTTLSYRDYWQERRTEIAQETAQNFRFLALFGENSQFSAQFSGRAPVLNQQAAAIRNSPVNPQTINSWQEQQLIAQGATDEMGIQVTEADINQAIAGDLGEAFLPAPAEAITGTGALTGTDALTDTAEDGEETEATEEAAEADTEPALPTVAPTATPRPTPPADEAAEQVPQIVDAIYQQYISELELSDMNPELDRADFRRALEQQYRRQLLTQQVQEELVPEDEFTPSEEPERVQARQIFLEVEVPDGASQEEIDEAYAERRDEARDIAEQLREGADFAELVEEYSDDPGSRAQGGDMGSFDSDGVALNGATYPPPIVDAAYSLEEGEISDPVRSQFGWHILEVTTRTVPDEEQQLRTARTEAFEEWLEEQREQREVSSTLEATPTPPVPQDGEQPTLEPTYLPGPPTPLPTLTPTPAADTNGDTNGLDVPAPAEPAP